MEALRTGLPAAVRVNLGSHVAAKLLTQLERLSLLSDSDGEHASYAPRLLPWFPKGLGWQFDRLCGWEIRSNKQHKRLKAYLLCLQEHGSLSRQEAVSMLPPLCLDVQPGQALLDLCAAPGSKSSQIIEMLHWEQNSDPGLSDVTENLLPRGVLIANELVPKRADLLTHTVNRLGSPCFAVTQLDAQFFPKIMDSNGARFLFDRVLADVPCSGDGTLRKSPELWGKWTPREGIGLHHRQYTILLRGLDLLKPGGRLVYSTCSFNPLEDEAVVLAALLRRHGGQKVTLIDLPIFEDLSGSPGLKTWVVPHPEDGRVCWERPEEVPDELREKLRAPLFPPAQGSEEAALWEEQRCRCRRFLPHKTSGGGFFIAVFLKDNLPCLDVGEPAPDCETKSNGSVDRGLISDHEECAVDDDAEVAGQGEEDEDLDRPAEQECVSRVQGSAEEQNAGDGQTQSQNASTGDGLSRSQRRKRRQPQQIGDYEIVPADDPAWLHAAAFFGLDPSLACNLRRKIGHPKKIYWISEQAGRFLACTAPFKMRVISAGVRVLEQLGASRQGAQPMWRTTQEGLPLLLQHGLKRRIAVSASFMKRLLSGVDLEVAELHAAAQAGEVMGLECLEASQEQLQAGHPPGLISGSLAVTLLTEATRTAGLAVSALLSGRCLMGYASQTEAAALCESMELEARTTALLSPVEATKPEGEASQEGGGGGGVCRQFQAGNCTFGDGCRFSHETTTTTAAAAATTTTAT
ncbi:unnamed protein product [Polarella glacialis]|uniref:Uncharacterized protein n=1 Tax=Polarella glacialis TaxID=89957 RepID=A0A813FBX0_POLGL|nr:unnamed protein product [Polarella glacialis]